MNNQKIIPHLWFDKEAVAAAQLYTEVFPNSKITHHSVIYDTPSGDCDIVGFNLMGFDFMSISAGPVFQLNPAISFFVKLASVEAIDRIWEKLIVGGNALMPLGEYPFSPYFGWLQDKFGVTWQLILTEEIFEPSISPFLMFTQEGAGRAEEAINFYASVFPDGQAQVLNRYGPGQEPEQEGSVQFGQMVLADQEFVVLDSAQAHQFKFNEAISLIVNCQDQAEIDYYWDKLSAVPEAEQCGWIKDKFGISWQIVPVNMDELMAKNPEKTTPVMLQMKKIIIADLEQAAKEL